MKFERAPAILVAGFVAFFVWLFATRAQKRSIIMDRELRRRSGSLDRPDMDETFAHEVTPADPVQAFRDSGAV